MNFYDERGAVIDHRLIESRAAEGRISLRTGCFCNPGAGETALELSREEIEHCFDDSGGRMTYEDFQRCIDDKSTGAVRVSLGVVTTEDDVDAFVDLARSFLR